jgi:hypothetical protein
LDAFEGLKSNTIIIYVYRPDWSKIPRLVRQAISSHQSGKYIPKTVIVDPKITQVIAIVPYTRDPNNRKQLFEEANKIIAKQSY